MKIYRKVSTVQIFSFYYSTLFLEKKGKAFFFRIGHLGELLGVGQIVDSDGQEDVKQSVCGGSS